MFSGLDLLGRGVPALAAVLGLLALAAWAARRGGIAGRLGGPDAGRLAVIATRAIDPRTKLVLVRFDRTDFLLAVGAAGIVTIESRPAPDSEVPGR